MKLTPKIIDLLLNLSVIEPADNTILLVGDGLFLRKNLLSLYRRTDNTESHELIIEIMAEGGYPWFAKLATGAIESMPADVISTDDSGFDFVMSEDDFLELLPANGHFH